MSLRALLYCPDEKTAKVVTQVLSDVDFTVDQAAEPFAAVKKLSSQPFDALVVECANEQNASLLMKSARNSNSNQGSLIVALVEGQIGVANAFRIGANLVLTKPIAVEQAKSTLRVARGLLRKGGEAAAQAPAPVKLPAPATGFVPPASSRPQPSAPPLPPPASSPVVPATPRPAAAPAMAMTGNFEVEADNVPQLDATEASLLESMGNAVPSAPATPPKAARPATGHTRPATWPAEPSSQHVGPLPEQDLTSVDSPFSALASPISETPRSTATSSAAAAPARIPSAPANAPAEIPVAYPDFPDLHPKEDVEARRKAPFIAVAAILFVAAGLYFGWSMLRRSTTTTPKPAEPIVNNNGGFPTAPTSTDPTVPAAAPNTNTTVKTTPAPETITRFVVPTEPAANPGEAGKSALQVHSEKRESRPAPDTSEPVAAPPALGTLTPNDSGTAISSLVAHPPTALPSESPQDVRISQGVSQGLLLKRVQPIYPQQARQARIEGAVELTATIGKDGSTKDIKVISGPALLGKVAVDAVRQWKYKPYYLNGEPVEVQTQIVLNFKLPN